MECEQINRHDRSEIEDKGKVKVNVDLYGTSSR